MTKICPITYEKFSDEGRYSPEGLRRLSRHLSLLRDFPYSAEEQRQEAVARATKMSIQGMQPKLSVRLDTQTQSFAVVDTGGRFILKPEHDLYPELPANEDLTMRLASAAGVEVPLHGLVYSKDGSLTYFVKRFDRREGDEKLAVEDFAQLSGRNRDTKYDSSMEKVAEVVSRFCTFPVVEDVRLFRLTLVNFLVGNEDMHLKNFSLIRRDQKVEFSPAYDLVNTTIALKNSIEEIALPLNGKKRKLTRALFVKYFAGERLRLPLKVVEGVLSDLAAAQPEWERLIERSFLSAALRAKYRDLLEQRRGVLQLR